MQPGNSLAPPPVVSNSGWKLPRRWARWVYTHNPFYALSAALVLAGLHVVFHDREAAAHQYSVAFDSWLMLELIGGYALLLAVTAFGVVRWGRVWDDARTILLTLLLLFVAMSVSFDKLVLTHSTTLVQVLVVGLVFSVGLLEGLRRGLAIRLPAAWRVPFYALLALFFVWPIVLMHLLDRLGDGNPKWALEWTLWGIYLFPTAAAAIVLVFVPAARMGPHSFARSGVPWQWPWFPWTLFGVLVASVGVRAYSLSVAFHPFPGTDAAFGVYFLAPLVVAVSFVVLELAEHTLWV